MTRIILATALIGSFVATVPADTWMAPSTQVIQSADGNVVVRIDPNLNRGKDKVPVRASVTRWDANTKSYLFVRDVTLRNPWRPVTVVITNDARFLVSFDDWFDVGTTDNAVVIYDLEKSSMQNYRLEDFLPEDFRKKLKRSISSVDWRETPYSLPDQTIYIPIPGVGLNQNGFQPHIVVDPAKKRVWLQKEATSE